MKDEIPKQTKMWTCGICNITCTNKNRTNHLRTDKHKKNEKNEKNEKKQLDL